MGVACTVQVWTRFGHTSNVKNDDRDFGTWALSALGRVESAFFECRLDWYRQCFAVMQPSQKKINPVLRMLVPGLLLSDRSM